MQLSAYTLFIICSHLFIKSQPFRSIETAGLFLVIFDILFFNYYYWISDNDFIKNIHPVSVTDENNVVLTTILAASVSSPSIFFAIMYDVGVHGEASIITIAMSFWSRKPKYAATGRKIPARTTSFISRFNLCKCFSALKCRTN